MAIEGKRNNRVVWHDVMPVTPPPKIVPHKTSKLLGLIHRLKIRRKPLPIQQTTKQLPKNRRVTAIQLAAIIGLAASAAFSAYYVLHNAQAATTQTTKSGGATASQTKPAVQPPGLVKGTPNYPTLLPAGKTISSLGGWVRPGDKSVFVYIDTINTIPINVSEQPLPDEFKADTSQQMELLARTEKANEKITVGATTVYIGSTAKGPQSVFFTKSNLLILVKSNDAITNDQWAAYVNSLQ